MTIAQRFWAKVNKNGPTPSHCPELGPCWEWKGVTNGKQDRGMMHIRAINPNNMLASHVAWFVETGHWPSLCVLHKCDNHRCVRFSHLFEGTVQMNNADMTAKGRGVIPQGEANGRSKLTTDEVKSIRTLYQTGEYTQWELANMFGLESHSVIS